MAKQEVLFLLSVDTEEEWNWDNPEFPSENCEISNIEKLPAFQQVCESLGIRTTYFVDYAVAENNHTAQLLAEISQGRTAEIGAHLHPWCNPPFYGNTSEAESHVVNLPEAQVAAKLDTLVSKLTEMTGYAPKSFRSGRWGIDKKTLLLLKQRGFVVDSSVYPFYENSFFSCEGCPLQPYWPSFSNPLNTAIQRDVMEIPVTAGFNTRHFALASKVHKRLSSAPFSWMRSIGFLWHTRLLRKIYLSPELSTTPDMKALIDASLANNQPVIHMYLHSSSLVDQVTGLLNVNNAYDEICQRIADTVSYLGTKVKVRFCTITEAAHLLKNAQSIDEAMLNWTSKNSIYS